MQTIPFKSDGYFIISELFQYTRDILTHGTYTLKQVGEITVLGKNTVKDIDLQRLKEMYTIDGEKLINPEKTTKYHGIDEFKLHNGYKYAPHTSLDFTWKKKQVVYD